MRKQHNSTTAKLSAYYMRLSKEIDPDINIYSFPYRDAAGKIITTINSHNQTVMICGLDLRAITFAHSKNDKEEVFEVWKRTYLELLDKIITKLST